MFVNFAVIDINTYWTSDWVSESELSVGEQPAVQKPTKCQ